MLASTKDILHKAHKCHYAVPHFNINNMEMLQGVVQAGIKLNSPIILATSEGAIKYAGINFLYNLAKTASELTTIPLALHLDHGQDFETIKKAIQIGYSSVMIDASDYDFEKNIQITKKVVQLAHKHNISVEAELGTIGGAEDLVRSRTILYTNPIKAQEFIKRTGCDFLAVAIGTSHGAYKFLGKSKLEINILKEIKERTNLPLVLHGASGIPKKIVTLAEKYGAELSGVHGVPDSEIKQAIKYGINKINTDTDLRIAFDSAIRKAIQQHPRDIDPRHILAPARDLIQEIAEERIRLFGCMNKT